MQKPIIQFNRVNRRFGGRDVLKEIDLQVPAGIIAGLVGPNGSGKTTLLKLMAGFIKTTSGEVRLFGLDPIAVLELRGLLKRLQTEHNLTMVLSSHLLGEVERLVDTIFMLNEGRSLFYCSPDKLLGEDGTAFPIPKGG